MSTMRKAAILVSIVALGASMAGCSTVPKVFSWLRGGAHTARFDVRPAVGATAEAPVVSPTDRLFDDAKAAINRRDYARALDVLQLAKQRSPDDARVLNAIAVVYDKLGRFDLSNRYYQLALAEEPNSPIVMANLRYSERLAAYAGGLRSGVALAAASPAPAPAAAAPKTPQITLAQSAVQPVRAAPLLVGGSLLVVNASSQPGAPEQVRAQLASAGWTVRTQLQIRPVQAGSQIIFAEPHRRVAEALARTLPFQVALQTCTVDCSGLELVVGENARGSAKARS
jgi:tetratricopeptide (TPR) repeat protein